MNWIRYRNISVRYAAVAAAGCLLACFSATHLHRRPRSRTDPGWCYPPCSSCQSVCVQQPAATTPDVICLGREGWFCLCTHCHHPLDGWCGWWFLSLAGGWYAPSMSVGFCLFFRPYWRPSKLEARRPSLLLDVPNAAAVAVVDSALSNPSSAGGADKGGRIIIPIIIAVIDIGWLVRVSSVPISE